MKKKIPAFKSARGAAAFVDKADLSQYDLSGAQTVRFEMKRKDKSINLRLPEELYDAVRQRAKGRERPHAAMKKRRSVRTVDNFAVQLDRNASGVGRAFGPSAVIRRNFADSAD